MEFVPPGSPCSFEVTFDSPSLPVAMSVYDDSGLTPVLIQGPSAMDVVAGNTYRAKFTPSQGKSYIIIKSVYTDGTFTTLDTDYASGSESVICLDISIPPPTNLTGFIESLGVPIVGGTVDYISEIIGEVESVSVPVIIGTVDYGSQVESGTVELPVDLVGVIEE
jgi:hypothetical protein